MIYENKFYILLFTPTGYTGRLPSDNDRCSFLVFLFKNEG